MSEIPSSPKRTSMVQVAVASWIGTSIEWYDFGLYGTASALVFNRLFFPAGTNPVVGLLASYAIFATGYAARPLGSILFGHYGDRIGRKKMLVLTLIMMGVATFLVGCLPGYSTLGVLAPIALVVLGFVQGLAVGGEWGGAVLMSTEHSPQGKRGFYGSWPQVGAPLGSVLAVLAFLLVTAIYPPGRPEFLTFGWRIPFLASIILVAVGLFIRARIEETPDFKQMKEAKRVARVPLFQLLRHNFKNALLAAGIFLGVSATVSIVSVWIISYGTLTLKVPQGTILNAVLLSNILAMFVIPVAGALSDRYGRRAISLVGAVWVLLGVFPTFWLIETRSPFLIVLGLCLELFGLSLAYGPQGAYFSELFGANVRYSGSALGNSVASILGGGLAPFIATALLGISGGASWPIAIYLVIFSLISVVSIFLARINATPALIPETAVVSSSAGS